jgi:isoleucyl-tRNA synthetase
VVLNYIECKDKYLPAIQYFSNKSTIEDLNEAYFSFGDGYDVIVETLRNAVRNFVIDASNNNVEKVKAYNVAIHTGDKYFTDEVLKALKQVTKNIDNSNIATIIRASCAFF